MNLKNIKIAKYNNHTFPNPIIEELCIKHGKIIKLSKGSVLFDEHSKDKTLSVYYLVDGVCAVSGISATGKEQIFLYQKAGDLLGHVPHLMEQNVKSHPYAYRKPTILTKTTCIFYEIPSKFFVEYLNQYPAISIMINQQLANNYSMTLAHLKQMQEESVVSSICRFLLQVADLKNGELIVPKLFTYSEISKFLGSHEVTVSRVMGRLKQEKLITKISGGLLIQNAAELENLIQNPDNFKYK